MRGKFFDIVMSLAISSYPWPWNELLFKHVVSSSYLVIRISLKVWWDVLVVIPIVLLCRIHSLIEIVLHFFSSHSVSFFFHKLSNKLSISIKASRRGILYWFLERFLFGRHSRSWVSRSRVCRSTLYRFRFSCRFCLYPCTWRGRISLKSSCWFHIWLHSALRISNAWYLAFFFWSSYTGWSSRWGDISFCSRFCTNLRCWSYACWTYSRTRGNSFVNTKTGWSWFACINFGNLFVFICCWYWFRFCRTDKRAWNRVAPMVIIFKIKLVFHFFCSLVLLFFHILFSFPAVLLMRIFLRLLLLLLFFGLSLIILNECLALPTDSMIIVVFDENVSWTGKTLLSFTATEANMRVPVWILNYLFTV